MNSQHKNEGHIIPDVYNRAQPQRKPQSPRQEIKELLLDAEAFNGAYVEGIHSIGLEIAKQNEAFLEECLRSGLLDVLLDYAERDIELQANTWYSPEDDSDQDSELAAMRMRFSLLAKTIKHQHQQQLRMKDKERLNHVAIVNDKLVEGLKILQESLKQNKK